MKIRKIILSLVVLAILMFAPAHLSAFSVSRLDNGITLIVERDTSAKLVGVDVWVKAGSGDETSQNNGVSHFIEHLVFNGTTTRKAGDIDIEIESLGATLNARASRDWAHFFTTVSSRYFSKALELIGDALINPTFEADQVESEKRVILDEITRKQVDYKSFIKDLLALELYADHPYALPIEGTIGSVLKIKREDIVEFHKSRYTGDNTIIVVVGDITPEQAAQEAKKFFGTMPKSNGSQNLKIPTAIKPIEKQIQKASQGLFKLTYVAFGFLGPECSSTTDVCAMDVLLTYLDSNAFGWMARNLRDKQNLIITGDADFLTQEYQGMVAIIASTFPDNADNVKSAISNKLSSIALEGIPDNELSWAKRALLGEIVYQNETLIGRANTIGFYSAIYKPEFARDYINCVQSINNDDIKNVARNYLNPERAVIYTINPAGGTE